MKLKNLFFLTLIFAITKNAITAPKQDNVSYPVEKTEDAEVITFSKKIIARQYYIVSGYGDPYVNVLEVMYIKKDQKYIGKYGGYFMDEKQATWKFHELRREYEQMYPASATSSIESTWQPTPTAPFM